MPSRDSLFKLPDPTSRKLSVCKATESSVQEWLNKLPIMDVRKMVNPVYALITELSALKIDSKTLFAMARATQSKMADVHNALAESYMKPKTVLTDVHWRAFEMAYKMDARLLMVYMRVLNDGAIDIKQRGEAVFRALECVYRIIHRFDLLYQKAPSAMWAHAHQLYAHASEANIQKRTLKGVHPHTDEFSIENLYIQILLLRCCQPSQLQMAQLIHFSENAPWLANNVRMALLADQPNALYVVNPKKASPPLYRDATEKYGRD